MTLSKQLREFCFHMWTDKGALCYKWHIFISKEENVFPHMSLLMKKLISHVFLFQSLIFLGCVAAAGLGVNLLCLAIYLSCLCCCRKDEEEEESKKSNSCCVTWAAVAAGLICWYVSPTVNCSHTERINLLKMQAA